MALNVPQRCRSAVAAMLVATALGAPIARAADVATGPVEVIRLTLHPGREADAERFLASLADAARTTGAAVHWRTLQRTDGDGALYVLVLQARDQAELESWAEFNPTQVLERAYGVARARELLALRESALARVERERMTPRPDLGFDGR